MIDRENKKRKGFVTEEDIATLLQKYEANTVLTLLQEVARYAGTTIDWDALVKKTSTGITNAREYQMLWRHLAYRDSLLPVEDGAQPLDDGSDLDYELEAFPHVNSDASVEAAAHVKVMINSYLPSESDIPDNTTVEAPLTINIPKGPSCRFSQEQASSSTRGLNITVPVSLQKQPPTISSTEGMNGNGSLSGSMASRKKRKKWSSDEDQELIAAVEKHGEGNWANIVKGDFKGDRTATQLSQRWSVIRKKRETSSVGTGQSGLLRTEVQTANQALSIAVGNRPSTRNITAGMSLNSTSGKTADTPVGISSGSSQLQNQSKAGPVQTSNATSMIAKSQVFAKKSSLNPNTKPDLLVAANSAATAACIRGPSASATTRALPSGASAKPSIGESKGAVLRTVQNVPPTCSPSSKTTHQMEASSISVLPQKPKVTTTEEAKLSGSGNTPKEQTQDKTTSTKSEMGVEKQVSSLDVDVKSEAAGVCEEVPKKNQNAVGNGNRCEEKEKVNVQGDETVVNAENLEADENAEGDGIVMLENNGI